MESVFEDRPGAWLEFCSSAISCVPCSAYATGLAAAAVAASTNLVKRLDNPRQIDSGFVPIGAEE
jgi:hypothetical protein